MGDATPHAPRANDRTPVAVAVEVTPQGGPGGRTLSGSTRDIGLGGFSLVVAEPFPVGTAVTADIRLGEGTALTHIRADARVVWVRGKDMGVAFVGADADNRRKLSERFLCNPLASAWD